MVGTAAEDELAAWLAELARRRAEVSAPGYWANIAANCAQWARDVSVGPFWTRAQELLDQWRTEYRAATGVPLLVGLGLPEFSSKEEDSIRGKLFRRCSEKRGFNALPDQGPPIPRVGDLVRTRVVCPYIDGVEFFANRLAALAAEMGLEWERFREGRLEGYFAQHVYVSQTVLYRVAGHEEQATVRCEIQVASELATTMWRAAHSIYELARGKRGSGAEDWQWEPDDPRFIANQLGHMIHLADGLLIQLRKSRSGKGAK